MGECAHQDGATDSDGISLGAASLGAELWTGARVSVPVDVPLPVDEHAARAAPNARINTIRFSMKDLLGYRRHAVRVAGWSVSGTYRP
jgi:hypothetical protein